MQFGRHFKMLPLAAALATIGWSAHAEPWSAITTKAPSLVSTATANAG